MADFTTTLAQLYAQARPQFQGQQARPTVLPFATGKTSQGYGDLGRGIGDYLGKAYIDPMLKSKEALRSFNEDPTQLWTRADMMSKAVNGMPPQQQEIIYANPEAQQQLQKFASVGFPLVKDANGQLRFGRQQPTTLEGAKVEQLQAGKAPEGALWAGETKDIATGGYYGAETKKTLESEIPRLRAEQGLFDVKAGLYPTESIAETEYKRAHAQAVKEQAAAETERAKAAMLTAQTKDERIDPAVAAAMRAERTAQAKEEREERAAQSKELLTALGTYSKNVRQRQNALATGKTADRYAIALDDASDLITFLDSTAHLEQAGPQQINLSVGTLENLANAYAKALNEKKSDKILQGLRQRAFDIYDRFQYRSRDGKVANALDDPRTKKIMQVFEVQRTVSRGKKELVVPNDMGLLNELVTKATGRYF